MSKCISHHGEYSEHRPDREGYCELCGDLDMEAHDRPVMADALREAAEAWRKHLLTTDASYVCAESWLKARADRIESGDGQ